MLLPIDLGGMMAMIVADIYISGKDRDDDVVMEVLLLFQLVSLVSALHIDQVQLSVRTCFTVSAPQQPEIPGRGTGLQTK